MKKLEDRIKRRKKMEGKGYLTDNQGRLIHRMVCREAHGEFPKNWVVHHMDEDKANNSPDNLIALPRELHNKLHTHVKGQRVLFTRKNIQDMITAYINLSKNKDLCVKISITISYDQVRNTELKPVTSELVSKSGSSLYR